MNDTSEPLPSTDPATRQHLIEQLQTVLAEESLLHEAEDLRPYESDGLTAYRQTPMLVALPETTEQVQQILRICHDADVPVVARGAGTGLSGGALPLGNGVLLGMAKFNQILDVDSEHGFAVVQPGVRNLAISEAVAKQGLYYAPDPSSQIACTIGGNVAENSGGVHCLKYGLTVHNIQQIKVVTITGELLTLGNRTLDGTGFDLLGLLNGSEGMLAVTVEITVKLLPKPEVAQLAMLAFDDIVAAGDTVADIIANGIIPGGMEMMDKLSISAVEDFAQCGYPRDAEAILLCELDGNAEEVASQLQDVVRLAKKRGATSIEIAETEEHRLLLWKGRKSAFPAVGRLAPDYYCMDGTIPRKHLAKVLSRINELSEQYDLPVANVFHAGDGNLHPLILFDANKPGALQRTEELGEQILQLCVEVGGTITGEHGVGVEKLNPMCSQFNALELTQFHDLKAAFDQKGLLNPGKAIPTLNRCADHGAMHVHHNQLPHPELERF